jgi:DNA replication protein DnaC
MEKLDSIITNRRSNLFKPRLRIVEDSDEQKLDAPQSTIPVVEGACPKCKGAGYRRADVPYGHPNFGKALACECKLAERKEKKQQELVTLSGINTLGRFQEATFDSFTFTLPNVGYAFRQARQFAACPLGWLALLGPCGCGKTHLAVSIAKERVVAGDTVLFLTVPKLLDYLRTAFSPDVEQSYGERLQEIMDVDLLVLDDYGAQKDTDWALEKMFQLINHRYNGCLPTIITSNNIDLQGVDPRIASRMRDRELVTLVTMEGARDYRVYGNSQDDEE